MKTALKITALAALLACGAIASQATFAQPQPRDERTELASEQRQVAPFSAVEVAGPYRVVVKAQGRQAVQLDGERKQLAEIETVVRGDTLIVRPVERKGFSFHIGIGKRHETVTVNITAASLKSLRMSGSGDVDLDGVGGEQFSIVGSGPGDLRARGAVRQLSIESSGSGDLDLHGFKADKVNVNMHGPGDVHLAGIGNELSVQLSGSGDLTADGLRVARVAARLRGPGNVKLSGSSRELELESSGSGDFEGCELMVEAARTVQRGPGNACVAGNIRRFDAELHGSGELTARGLQAQTAQLRMGGPGNVQLAGSVGSLNVELSGSGDLEAGDLKVGTAVVRSHGPGGVKLSTVSDTLDAELHSSGELNASLAAKRLLLTLDGPGDARLAGKVAQLSARIGGSGSLEGRHLTADVADVAVRGPGSAAVNVAAKGRGNGASLERGQLLLVDRSGTRHVADRGPAEAD